MYLSVGDCRHVVPCPDASLILKQKLSSNGSSVRFGQKNKFQYQFIVCITCTFMTMFFHLQKNKILREYNKNQMTTGHGDSCPKS